MDCPSLPGWNREVRRGDLVERAHCDPACNHRPAARRAVAELSRCTDSSYQGRQAESNSSRAPDQWETRSQRCLASGAPPRERVYRSIGQQLREVTSRLERYHQGSNGCVVGVEIPGRTTSPRQIHTDGPSLPKDLQPSWMGYPVVNWKGDTLVVDTMGISETSWVDLFGHPRAANRCASVKLIAPAILDTWIWK
jgi:hypothetical protein